MTRKLVKYRGQLYVAADIDLTPPVSSGAVKVVERDYTDDVRGVYRQGNRYFGVVKLKWQQHREYDDLTFSINPDTAWAMAIYIIKDGDPNKVLLNREEVDTLQVKVSVGEEQETPEAMSGKPVIDVAGSVVDLSGHYVRVSTAPDIILEQEASEVTSIEGKFCLDHFHVMGWRYDVPEEVVRLFVDTLRLALKRRYPATTVTLDYATHASGSSCHYGSAYAFNRNHREVRDISLQIEQKLIFPIWREVYDAYVAQKTPVPVNETVPIHAQTSVGQDRPALIEKLLVQVSQRAQQENPDHG